MSDSEKRSALVIGAHLDDCECGSIAGVSCRLSKMGWRVVFLNTIDNSPPNEIATRHAHEAARLLGAEKIILPFSNNHFHPHDHEAVAAVAKVIQEVNPTIAFIPWPHDNHYDHARTAKAAMEALSYMNRFAGGTAVKPNLKEILAYEISSWQTRDFAPDFHVAIDQEIDAAVQAIRAFKTISESCLDYYVKEKLYRCQHWGLGCGRKYAEGLKHLGPQFPVRSMLPELFDEDLFPVGSVQYPWGGRFFG